mgnify:CR=1 FL=1
MVTLAGSAADEVGGNGCFQGITGSGSSPVLSAYSATDNVDYMEQSTEKKCSRGEGEGEAFEEQLLSLPMASRIIREATVGAGSPDLRTPSRPSSWRGCTPDSFSTFGTGAGEQYFYDTEEMSKEDADAWSFGSELSSNRPSSRPYPYVEEEEEEEEEMEEEEEEREKEEDVFFDLGSDEDLPAVKVVLWLPQCDLVLCFPLQGTDGLDISCPLLLLLLVVVVDRRIAWRSWGWPTTALRLLNG